MIRTFWMLAAAALTLGLAQSPAIAQSGPPTSGQSAAVFFIPATVELVAGFNGSGGAGDGGLATAAQLSEPYGIAYDSTGNLYIADSGNDDVRKIDRATGDISTFAGTGTFGNTAPAATALVWLVSRPDGSPRRAVLGWTALVGPRGRQLGSHRRSPPRGPG